MESPIPQIQPDVPGPDGQPGFLLIVPRSEAIDWDIRNEIGSTSRHWMRERHAWWVAAPYRHAAEGIVDRYAVSQPAPEEPASAPLREPEPEPVPARARRGALAPLRARWAVLEAHLRRWLRASAEADSA